MRYGFYLLLLWTINVTAANLTMSSTLTYDRLTVSQDHYLLRGQGTGIPYDPLDRHGNGTNTVDGLVCRSATDATTGACSVNITSGFASYRPPAGYGGDIRLRMVNEQTSATREIIVKGYYTSDCTFHILWQYQPCEGDGPIHVTLYIQANELRKMTAGVWKASLVTVEATESLRFKGVWTINLTLNVMDTRSQQIYFPEFRFAAPVINLKLNNRPGTAANLTASGQTTLDMCLYDGSNSSSSRISLQFQDEGSASSGRPAGQFSVYRQGGDKTQTANRLDYQVQVLNPTSGQTETVSNGREMVWTNTNRPAILRPVVLPGVPGVSLCVPAPITLITPAFTLADKTTGRYSGRLRITYTPSTTTN